MPEATFQRAVYPLAWLAERAHLVPDLDKNELRTTAQAGLRYALRIQHPNGSFDQAFPFEQSFGATAFLVHPLLASYKILHSHFTTKEHATLERALRQATDFLVRHDERHSHIANHLAGAVLSLYTAGDFFDAPRYRQRGQDILARILGHQSAEGWFLEYEGADPGYQTLCLYYLAEIYQRWPTPELEAALARAIDFLAWFAHPDGTFGGEYGSRRTAIYYPGGIARLSQQFPAAAALTAAMLAATDAQHTTTLYDIDMGNLAPLLSTYLPVLEADLSALCAAPPLPWQTTTARDFPQAGLYIRSTEHYYAVFGASNGGVLKVFDKMQRRIIYDDGGYAGLTERGQTITTQITAFDNRPHLTEDSLTLQTSFYAMLHAAPTPARFVALRVLNLTAMRSIPLGNLVKRALVRLLISGKARVPLRLTRRITWHADHIILHDRLEITGSLRLRALACGVRFTGIHMASANYFARPIAPRAVHTIDVETLNQQHTIETEQVIGHANSRHS
ncbi:MAG: hypothetical protein ACLFTK_17110 [Anaerolineales bacterium]